MTNDKERKLKKMSYRKKLNEVNVLTRKDISNRISVDQINREEKQRKFGCKFFLNEAIVNISLCFFPKIASVFR